MVGILNQLSPKCCSALYLSHILSNSGCKHGLNVAFKALQIATFNKCFVSTWSPLITTFNSRPGRKLNFNIRKDTVGLFGVPELRTTDGFYLLKEHVTDKTDNLLKESCSHNRSRKIVEIFDELSDTLCQVADLAEFLRVAHPDQSYADVARETCIFVSSIVEKMNTNRELYSALKDVVYNSDKFPTTPMDDLVAKLFLVDFEKCGIHLEEEKRQYVVNLNDYILQLGQEFMAGAVTPRVTPKTVLPENIRHLYVDTLENINVLILINFSCIWFLSVFIRLSPWSVKEENV